LVVQTITSSVDFVTGSTRFGSSLSTSTHQFTGSVSVTGSLAVVTTGTEFQVTNTGVNFGNTLTDSHIISGSLTVNPGGLFVSGSGLIGVGTTSPTNKLNVLVDGGGSDDGILIGVGSQGDGIKIVQRYLSNRVVATLGQSNYSGATDSGALRLYDVGGTETIRLSGKSSVNSFINSGNVGIGTNNPSTFLHISGSNTTGRGQLCIQSNNVSNAARASWYYNTTLQGNIGTTGGDFYIEAVNALQILAGGSQRMTLDSSGNVSIANGTFSVSQGGATRAIQISGNSCNQGAAFNYKIVRHYPVVSSGNKLIIPFVSQENLNSNTVVKVFGHSARFNARAPIAFSAYFAVGHLSVLSDLTAWGVNGNIASIGYGGGMNVEINFSSAYTSSESNGIFITIEYMTNTPSYSINVAGITMN
jgi:hypothetical protein